MFVQLKSSVLETEEAIAACMAYVDLNPIRAQIADTPEDSDFTSVRERMADVKTTEEVTTADAKDSRVEHGRRAGWLSPMAVQPKRQKVRERSTNRRTSNKGCFARVSTAWLEFRGFTRPLAPTTATQMHNTPTHHHPAVADAGTATATANATITGSIRSKTTPSYQPTTTSEFGRCCRPIL